MSLDALNHLPFKDLQDGEVSDTRIVSLVLSDNSFGFSITKMMTPWPTCMKNWYYPVYCNPFQMLWWGPDLYSPCVNYTTRSNRAKESHDNSLLMNYVFLQQVSMSVDFWQDKSQGLLIFIFHYLGKWSQCLLGIGNSIVQLFCNKQYNRKHNVPAIPRLDGTSSLIFIFHYLAQRANAFFE